MTLRRVTGSIAQMHNVLVHAPQSSPWPMCRTCWQPVEYIAVLDDTEPSPGRNPLKIRVLARCHDKEEVVEFDMLSEETLAQDPEALQKLAARWPFFNEAIGHVGN